jgi:GTPase SAR1 family protein
MTQVVAIATKQRQGLGLTADSFASVNTLTSSKAAKNLDAINLANSQSSEILVREPVIARVVTVDQAMRKRVYYICRANPVTIESKLLASYKAPVGRLASLSVGDQLQLSNGDLLDVVERTRLRPIRQADEWDSKDSIYEDEGHDPITIKSLRGLLRKIPVQQAVKDVLSQLLAEDAQAVQVFDGIRRDRIVKMGLRDQPILDKYQDEIFRLPLNKRLLILGAPGTGKTTTLIRRLGQKLDVNAPESLSEGERRTIDTAAQSGGAVHSDSWQMFTPTELLKQYLKEGFSREGIPASDLRLKTWVDYRRELGRNVFGILRSPGVSGYFTLKDQARIISSDACDQPIPWFEEFDAWQRLAYLQDLKQGINSLAISHDSIASDAGKKIVEILEVSDISAMPALFVSLQPQSGAIQALATDLKALVDKTIDAALNLALNRNPYFIEELGKFIDQLHVSMDVDSESDDDADIDAEDEDATLLKTGRGPAIKSFRLALKAQARADAAKRTLSKASRNAKVIDWLGDRTLSTADRAIVGPRLLLLAAARRFVNPVKRYQEGISKRYRSFRREKQETGRWYRAEKFAATDLHPLELDMLLLSSLRTAGDMLSRLQIVRRIENPYWAALQTVQRLHKNQILVDEATDFSPIQLACMAALANPQLRSFFACGDFNQRLTTWGSRSIDDLRWVLSDIDIRHVSVSYRQSRQLNELARSIIRVLGSNEQDVSLPPYVNNDGEAPVLLEYADHDEAVDWLSSQVRAIASYLQQLPSTAVFVNTEAEVLPLADALNQSLEDDNIRVVACPRGQVMGNDNDVRVFDIQHIKGLEFEAVFFLGIDHLAAQHPTLFDKYLYVGATRAATYLGVTCEGSLPVTMEPLRQQFTDGWRA